ncbi:hypothetical protein I2483_02855 [Sporosarcina sp. E16_3]|uniref:hypothetical protein n=1 Tax=Sporosarcina sp. E16_3 TaxID=2789293 RepID=UPI001A9273D2|nr:hypothetical protein [Sporosarcina sp. E16_3]MBO0600592.1 hypothetical protein [Sporosarcina sp. E16_3]
MIVFEAFKKLHRNIILIIYPIIYDLVSLAIGMSIVGFYGKNLVSIRMILEMGIPSVSNLSNIPLLVNDIGFLTIPVEIPPITLAITITAIMIGAFLQGCYIGYLSFIAKDVKFNFKQLFKTGMGSWIQFIILEVIIFLGKIGVTAFLAIFFGIIGVFASLVFFITLRILFIYLEFTMVVDRTGLVPAIKSSRNYLMNSLMITLPLVLVMYIVSSLISLFLHYFWSPLVVIGLIFVYAYIMTAIQLALMMVLCKSKEMT